MKSPGIADHCSTQYERSPEVADGGCEHSLDPPLSHCADENFQLDPSLHHLAQVSASKRVFTFAW